MRKIKVEDAVGQTLCHDMTGILPGGKKGVAFKRGHVIRAEDIPAMLDIGKSHVFVWEPGRDVHEDECALACAEAAQNLNVTHDTNPSEGKVLFYAQTSGLFRVNCDALRRINCVEDYTITCLPDCFEVTQGQKLGGVRIIPLVTARENVAAAVSAAKDGAPVFSVLPYSPLKCGVVITGSEVYYGRIQDKFEPIMRRKLDRFGADVLGVTKAPDDLGAITQAVAELESQGAQLILLTGGMSVDPDDLTAEAIRLCSERVITQGVPMQPGNMLTIAQKGGLTVIGVPGASMHSPVTSLDVFLPRIFAGVPISADDIPGLGAGGFCSGCAECTYPRCYFGR